MVTKHRDPRYFDAVMHLAVDAQDHWVETIKAWIDEHNPTGENEVMPDATIVAVVQSDNNESEIKNFEVPPPVWSNEEQKSAWIEGLRTLCALPDSLFTIIVTSAWIADGEGAEICMEKQIPVRDLPEHMREDFVLVHMSCARGDRLIMFANQAESEITDTGVLDSESLGGDFALLFPPIPSHTTPHN